MASPQSHSATPSTPAAYGPSAALVVELDELLSSAGFPGASARGAGRRGAGWSRAAERSWSAHSVAPPYRTVRCQATRARPGRAPAEPARGGGPRLWLPRGGALRLAGGTPREGSFTAPGVARTHTRFRPPRRLRRYPTPALQSWLLTRTAVPAARRVGEGCRGQLGPSRGATWRSASGALADPGLQSARLELDQLRDVQTLSLRDAAEALGVGRTQARGSRSPEQMCQWRHWPGRCLMTPHTHSPLRSSNCSAAAWA